MNTTVENKEGRHEVHPQEASRVAQNYVTPDVNIFETKDGYTVTTDMPGVGKAGLEVTVDGNELVITGHREQTEVKGNSLHRESSSADYRRVFELDPVIDTGKIDAKIDQGVLTIRLPKSERVKPRKVTVSD